MLNPYANQYAFFELNNGFGWKRPEGEVVYNIKDDYFYVKPEDKELKKVLDQEGRAYIQVLFQEFLAY